MIEVIEIELSSPLYEDERELRNSILVRPLGFEDGAGEKDDKIARHFVAIENSKLVGCVIVFGLNSNELKLRQMAVSSDVQKRGVGTELINYVIQYASENKYTSIVCDARKVAIEFYIKNGFKIISEEFIQVGIPHVKMKYSCKI